MVDFAVFSFSVCSFAFLILPHLSSGVVMDNASFNMEKRRLRELYKRYKVGIVKSEQLSEKDKLLLKKYFGIKDEQV